MSYDFYGCTVRVFGAVTCPVLFARNASFRATFYFISLWRLSIRVCMAGYLHVWCRGVYACLPANLCEVAERLIREL